MKVKLVEKNDIKYLFMCHFAGQAQKITIYRDVKLISNS